MNPRTLSAAYRRELIVRERRAQRDILRYYGEALDRISRELRQLDTLIAERPSRRLLVREQRLLTWERQTKEALTDYVLQVERRITDLQGQAVGQASGDAYHLTNAALGKAPSAAIGFDFNPPHPSVPAALIGYSSDGEPLGLLLGQLATKVAANVREELIVGVIRGKGPREIARNVTRASGMAYNRALLIARTESIRAYRTTTLEAFKANPVVQGWSWQCTYDTRTCAVCWAMSGSLHTTDEGLNSHPGCRCTMLPRTVSWQDLGFTDIPDTRPRVEEGPAVFKRLSPDDQRKILGPSKYDAYRTGRVTLPDLVAPTHSERWGPGLRERSLTDALAA